MTPRPGTLASGAALGAITIRLAVEAAASPGPRPGPVVAVCAGLFTIMALCWLRAVTLLVLSGLPLGRAVAQHRVHTGAPLDPRAPWAPWAPIPPPGAAAVAGRWGWARAHLLLSQARFRNERIQLALTWTLITTGSFLAWTAAVVFSR
ncbi:MAG TPA: hypothetical protein VGN41_12655 [Streptosporangiaceae bacterium]